MPIQWRKQMTVGNLIIDLDHRYLIALINQVEYAMRHPEEKDILDNAVGQLKAYAREHFDREERIQLHISYQHYHDHKFLHQQLLERLDAIAERIDAHHERGELTEAGEEIAGLLRDWLLNHVLKEDMKMKCDLEQAPPNLMG